MASPNRLLGNIVNDHFWLITGLAMFLHILVKRTL